MTPTVGDLLSHLQRLADESARRRTSLISNKSSAGNFFESTTRDHTPHISTGQMGVPVF